MKSSSLLCQIIIVLYSVSFIGECCFSWFTPTSRESDSNKVNELNQFPHFKWINCSESYRTNFDKCMKVWFPSNKQGDVMLLHRVQNDDSVLEGHFENESEVEVSVSINEAELCQKITIAFDSPRVSNCTMFEVNMATKTTECIKLPQNMTDRAIPSPFVVQQHSRLNINSTSKPFKFHPNGYVLRVHVYYDSTFRNRFGPNISSIDTRIRAVFSFVKNIYSNKPSLTTKIEPQVITTEYRDDTWSADEYHLRRVNSIVASSSTNANAYVFLGYQNNQPGTIGIAWINTTCGIKPYRTSISEYFMNDAVTAVTVAHEIGHNLGMEHDFEGGNLNRERFSKKGEPCTGIGGYMDYRDNPTKWSPCSAEDFYAYFSAFDRPGYVCLATRKDTPQTSTEKIFSTTKSYPNPQISFSSPSTTLSSSSTDQTLPAATSPQISTTPDIKGCSDRFDFCKRPSIQSLCDSDTSIRETFCRKSCKTCDSGGSMESCENNWTGFWCTVYQFECSKQERVRKNCRKTCDMCF